MPLKEKDIVELLLDTSSQRSAWEKVADKTLSYYDGTGHWTSDEIEERVKAREKSALTVNLVFKHANLIAGLERLFRTDVRYVPFENSDTVGAEIYNVSFKHLKALNKLPYVNSDVFLSGIILSRGYWEVYYDPFINDIRIKKQSPYNVFIDPNSIEYDPNDDAEWVATSWWVPIEKAKQLFPGKSDIIERNAGVESIFDSNAAKNFLYDIINRRVRYTQLQLKEWTTESVWLNPENPIEQSAEEVVGWIKFDKEVAKVKFYTMVGATLIEENIESPYGDMFTVVPYMPVFVEGYDINVMDQIVDLNDLVNLYMSEALDNVRQQPQPVIFYNSGAFDEEEEEKLENLHKHKRVKVNGKIQDMMYVLQPPGRIDNPMAIAQAGMGLMREILNVSEVLTGGVPGRVDSALGITQLTKNTMASFEMILDNFDRSKVILGKLLARCIKNFYSDGKIIRLMGDDGVELNLQTSGGEATIEKIDAKTGEVSETLAGGMDIDVDIIVDKAPDTPTTKYMNMAMAQQIVSMLPDPRLLIELVRMSDFPYKDKWISVLQQTQPGAVNQNAQQQGGTIEQIMNDVMKNEVKQQ